MSLSRLLAIVLIWAISLASPVSARDLTSAERLSDFDQLVSLVRSSYGMLDYKKQLLGIDLDKLVAAYRPRIASVPSDGPFYDLLAQFVAEFKDGHFGFSRPSSRRARLGFSTMRLETKAIITRIDRKTLGEETFPFQIGDELVALDGKPVERLLGELVRGIGAGNEAGSLSEATRMLTFRHGAWGDVPHGIIKVDVRRHADGEIQSVMLPWIVQGETLPGLSFYVGGAESTVGLPHTAMGNLSMNSVAAALAEPGGSRWTPEGAHPVKSKFFEVATFDTEKGPMGYLRIPDFVPSDVAAAKKEMRKILSKDLWFTKGLVIDLNDNPGGYITYCHALAAMFMSKPLEIPTVSLRASRLNLAQMLEWADNSLDPVQSQLVKISVENLRAALEKDQAMTDFGYVYGFSAMAPDQQVTYDKPVVLLINEQSFSCGDIFPALMQDNKRATLFGTTTGGGGGAVAEFGELPNCGAHVRLTLNVMKRTNGTFIENHGVSPDIAYEPTQEDAANGFTAYKAAYTKALVSLVK